jgi:hypothetical protein
MLEIKVATLNLRGRHDRWQRRRELVVAEILNEQPELVSLQEIQAAIPIATTTPQAPDQRSV